MTKKRVIFHIGTHKTGTTYLQSFFSQNVDFLKSKGVDYPFAETQETIQAGACIGNVVRMLYLDELIGQKIHSPKTSTITAMWNEECNKKLVKTIESSDCDTVLFSSEGMSSLPLNKVRQLREALGDKFNVEIVILVRDPFDYFYSAWRQIVKAHMSPRSFKEHIKSCTEATDSRGKGMFSAFETYTKYDFDLKVINYDTYKRDLARKFLEFIHVDTSSENTKFVEVDKTENRSLSPSESELMAIINKNYSGSHFPALVRHFLLKRADHSPETKSFYNSEAHKLLLDSFRDSIAMINQYIIGEQLKAECRTEPDTSVAIEKNDLETFIEAYKFVQSEQSRKKNFRDVISHKFKTVTMKNIPSDFNPSAYLDMNKDVAIAGLDPYEHYSNRGHREGRPYRYF